MSLEFINDPPSTTLAQMPSPNSTTPLSICTPTVTPEPSTNDLLYEQGEKLLEEGFLEEAAGCFRRVLADTPLDPATVIMLARTLHRLKKPAESLHYYRLAQRLAPHLSVVHLMAGVTALESGRREEARAAFGRALEVDPDNVSARLCLCMTLLTMPSSEQEMEETRKAYAAALHDLVQTTTLDGVAAVDKAVEALGMMSPFFLPYQGENDRDLQEKYGTWVCRVMAAKYPQFAAVAPQRMGTGEKLRIGFVSGHFYDHSVWKIVTRGWYEHLDRSRFMIIGYYTGDKIDGSTEAARRLSDVFVMEQDITAMAGTIARHSPHVLIYPGIGMDPHTLRLAALRLAPVQCVSWGHPETTGLPTVDYFLSSDLMEPPDSDCHYTEQLVSLPNLSVLYEPILPDTALPQVVIPGVNTGDVCFLCCQNLMKYLPQHDDVFPAIAARVPNAKFVFIRFSEEHGKCFEKRMDTAFGRYELPVQDHLVFVPPLNGTGYAAMNASIDIYLDSIGWSGGNTTFESLVFNKPIVTFPGTVMRSRHTAAILQMMGVGETIASTKEEYVDIAVRLANDHEWRRTISERIAENKHLAYGDRLCISALESFLTSSYAKALHRKMQQVAM